jgi:hypothetical protein
MPCRWRVRTKSPQPKAEEGFAGKSAEDAGSTHVDWTMHITEKRDGGKRFHCLCIAGSRVSVIAWVLRCITSDAVFPKVYMSVPQLIFFRDGSLLVQVVDDLLDCNTC